MLTFDKLSPASVWNFCLVKKCKTFNLLQNCLRFIFLKLTNCVINLLFQVCMEPIHPIWVYTVDADYKYTPGLGYGQLIRKCVMFDILN